MSDKQIMQSTAVTTSKRKLVEDYDDSESDNSDNCSDPKKPCIEENKITVQPTIPQHITTAVPEQKIIDQSADVSENKCDELPTKISDDGDNKSGITEDKSVSSPVKEDEISKITQSENVCPKSVTTDSLQKSSSIEVMQEDKVEQYEAPALHEDENKCKKFDNEDQIEHVIENNPIIDKKICKVSSIEKCVDKLKNNVCGKHEDSPIDNFNDKGDSTLKECEVEFQDDNIKESESNLDVESKVNDVEMIQSECNNITEVDKPTHSSPENVLLSASPKGIPEPFTSSKDEEVYLQISDNAQSATSYEKKVEIPTLSESLKIAVSDDSFISKNATVAGSLIERKKDGLALIDIDASLVNTPCDSGETSPTISTPMDICPASASMSPLLRDDTVLATTNAVVDDENSKENSNENVVADEKEVKPMSARQKGKMRKAALRAKKLEALKNKKVIIDEELNAENDDDSRSSATVTSKKKVRSFRSEVICPESTEVFTVAKIIEYMWPLENGEHYFIQEHMAQYLGITSFKRKYKDVRRRPIESQEKEYLRDLGLVSEMACDLGLTAVRSEDTFDVLFNDFPIKYEELQKDLRERKEALLKEKGKAVDYHVANLDKSKMDEYSRKAILSAAKWNIALNRERREERRYSFNMDTFTLNVQMSKYYKRPAKFTKMSSYPVAVLPGQYTDYYKEYSYRELKCLPLHTVINGPFTDEEFYANSPNSNGVSSSVDKIELIKSVVVEPEPPTPIPLDAMSVEKQYRCKSCNGGRDRNKNGKSEPLIICGTCRVASHPTCIDLTLAMIEKIEAYSWQCMDCKTCVQCSDPDDEEKMIFCDMCDRGYHIYCVGLRKVPNGRWHCKNCAVCFTCGARTPSGIEQHIKNSEWQHEFKKEKDNKQLKYICTLCVPCDKYWKRRQFCSICFKVYRSIPEDGMVRCTGCPKYVHKEGCSVVFENDRYCNVCYKDRNKTALNHSRILAAAKKKMLSSF